MKSILITGANRGLGLGMVKYLTQQNNVDRIIATCRNISQELQQLSNVNKNIHIINLDVKNTNSFDGVALNISKIVGDDGLNVLINNAAVTTKFTKLNLVKEEQLMENLAVNTIAPIMLTKSIHPLLKIASQRNSGKPMGVERAAVVNMSSVLGSITQNDQGGFYPYRCSKAALNAATKSMSIDFKTDGILVVSMHPGWVRTDMGGKKAPLEVSTSIEGIFRTINDLKDDDSGKFYQYDGTELPW